MRRDRKTQLVPALALAVFVGCAQGDQSGQAADSTARNLTLASTESSAVLKDVPAAPASRPAAEKPKPEAPRTWTLAAGTRVDMSVSDTISSRTAKAGDSFTATVRRDVKDAAGHIVIPQGSTVTGTVVEVKPAPNPNSTGTMALAVNSVTVRGISYAVEASIDSVETVMKGRGIEGADAARVGAGAAAGAILGRVVGGDKKGTIIGGVVGAATGAAVSAAVKDVDIVLPAGARLVISLTKLLSVKAG